MKGEVKMLERIKKLIEKISEKEFDGLLLVRNEKLIKVLR
jgi:hypothetical protein